MTYKVSTSEVATFLTCRRRWMYAHHPSYHLEPRTLGIALTRGVLGHKALEIYYGNIMMGNSHDKSVNAAQDFIVERAIAEFGSGDPDKSTMITSLGLLLSTYFEEHKWMFDLYKVAGVEYLVEAKLPDTDILFAGRIDLLLEVIKGSNRGEFIPWDHKFTYNFWNDNKLKMNPQMSNYVWALRETGKRSRKGIMSMVRYRDNALDHFKQEEVPTTSVVRDNFMFNHTVAAKRIVELKQKETVDVHDGVTRSASTFNCEYCPFATLCYTEVSGQDSSTMVKASFRPNSYGYDSELDVE